MTRYTVKIVRVVEETHAVSVEADTAGEAVDRAIDAVDRSDIVKTNTLDFDVVSVRREER